ncbi:MAG: hypothetical protein GF368_01560 [Candidatus Aenigmarchaeota archaeon]|nr:hypothetical protein [Candidatus Aenigmarchaeota archaeon]
MVLKIFLKDFDWGNVEKEKVYRVKATLKTIKNQTTNREKILNDIVSFINESDENEF